MIENAKKEQILCENLQPFIEEVLPNAEQDNVLVTESMDVVINAKSYLS